MEGERSSVHPNTELHVDAYLAEQNIDIVAHNKAVEQLGSEVDIFANAASAQVCGVAMMVRSLVVSSCDT